MMRAILLLCLAAASAAAEPAPIILRFGAVAPDGTAWARVGRSWAQNVEQSTGGTVHVKWYLGGIAGDDVQMGERLRRGQLDGAAGANMLCQRLAPSMRVLQLAGFYRDRDEWSHVRDRLRPLFDEELKRSGFVDLGLAGIGPSVIVSRTPVTTLAELRKTKLWVWDEDEIKRLILPEMGLHIIPAAIADAARDYEEGKSDGFLALPGAALAFQWSPRAHYFTPLVTDYFVLCQLLSLRALDQLTLEQQQAIRSAAAKVIRIFDDVGRQQDEALLNGLFEHQGIRPLRPTPAFEEEFAAAAHSAERRLGARLIPEALLKRVVEIQEEYRSRRGDRK
jgi:TRAP-type C4-dicarboxylate transport system substrate-binding protein